MGVFKFKITVKVDEIPIKILCIDPTTIKFICLYLLKCWLNNKNLYNNSKNIIVVTI